MALEDAIGRMGLLYSIGVHLRQLCYERAPEARLRADAELGLDLLRAVSRGRLVPDAAAARWGEGRYNASIWRPGLGWAETRYAPAPIAGMARVYEVVLEQVALAPSLPPSLWGEVFDAIEFLPRELLCSGPTSVQRYLDGYAARVPALRPAALAFRVG